MHERSCGAASSWKSAVLLLFTAALSVASVLPAQAAVGRTAGTFSVSNSGTARYSIPIFTPPGVRGLQPSVALVYDSSSRIGTAGIGWNLAYGGSSISFCNKTVAQDGEAAGVRLSPDYTFDALCIDGNRMRLQSGDYAEDGSVYATEIADFSRITAVGTIGIGPSSWTVERKDGLIYTYGGTSDSRILVNGWASSGSFSTVSTWRLSQIEDRSGNKILFVYETPDSTTAGTTHIKEIKWTQTAYNSGTYLYSIQFNYDSDGNAPSSSPTGYVSDNSVRDTDLLRSISVKNSGTVVRHYLLDYDPSPTTDGMRLAEVKECNDDTPTDCLDETSISYQNGQVGLATSPAFTASVTVSMANGRFDFDGNGFLDLIYRKAGTWYVRFNSREGYGSETSTGNNEFYLMAGDPFGDGHDVLLGLDGTSYWHVFKWNGSAFSKTSTGITYVDSADVVSLTDVDADGRDDLVYVKNSWEFGEIQMGTRPSTSSGSTLSFASEIITSFIPEPIAEGWYFSAAWGAAVYPSQSDTGTLGEIDSNGDGRKDVLLTGGETFFCESECWMWDYSTILRPYKDSESSYQYEAGFDSYGWPLVSPAHLNSDGCTDFVKITDWTALLSGCRSGFGISNAAGVVRGTIDWDGDGRQDLLIYYSSYTNLYVQRSTGEGFAAPVDTGIPAGCSGYYCTLASNLFVTDAEGLSEILCASRFALINR